jgi:ethanolamine utilization protein EutM
MAAKRSPSRIRPKPTVRRPRRAAAVRRPPVVSAAIPEAFVSGPAPALEVKESLKATPTMNEAIGLIETKGLIAHNEPTDAMLKAANVSVVKAIQIGNAMVTVVIKGDVGSVRAAVDAGAAAASKVGELLASHVIPRPAQGLMEKFV